MAANNNNTFDPFDFEGTIEEEKSSKVATNSTTATNNKGTTDFHPWSGDADTSFDTSFQFTAEPAEFGYNPFASSTTAPPATKKDEAAPTTAPPTTTTEELFPSDPMANVSGEGSQLLVDPKDTTVQISIREQFSTIYDDAGSPPSCFLEGSILVQPSSVLLTTGFDAAENSSTNSSTTSTTFLIVVQDAQQNLERLDEVPTVSTNVTTAADREAQTTVFQVSLPHNSLLDQPSVPVATYTCNPQLRPIPMLVKSRVQVTDDVSRVGFKVRANPSNPDNLSNLVILIAVPPFVQGETVKMSRKGGVWDEMKRTICWTLDELAPGQVLEIQAQFQSGNKQNLASVDLQFPVLVRANVPRLFSGIDVTTTEHHHETDTTSEEGAAESSVKSNVTKCTRILHRKV